MTNSRQLMQEDAKTRVLRLLAENPEVTQRELSQAVGISTGSVHYLLNALLEMGLIKFGNLSASKDKRRYAYILTPQGMAQKAELTRRFLARKLEEYEDLSREIAALEDELADSSAGRKAKGLSK